MPEGWTVPVQNTLPDVKFDEILASAGPRHARLPAAARPRRRRRPATARGDDLAATFKRFEPGARDAAPHHRPRSRTAATNIRRSIHNLRLLVEAVGDKDTELTQLIDSSNAVFRSFAAQDRNLRCALQQLPPTLRQTNTHARPASTSLAPRPGPGAAATCGPTARALGPTLRQTRPFLRETTPIIRDQLRPFARDVRPTVRSLRPAARGLAEVTPDLVETFRVLNYLFNTLAYNPPGKAEEGYLFWAAWANHLGALVFSTQDAHGPIRRGTILISCSTARVLDTIIAADPRLGTDRAAHRPCRRARSVCPQSSQAGGAGAAPARAAAAPGLHRAAPREPRRCRSRPRPSAACS